MTLITRIRRDPHNPAGGAAQPDPHADGKALAAEAGSPAERKRDPRKARAAVAHGLREIYVGPAAHNTAPTIVERDEIEPAEPGPYTGRVYLGWMAHSDEGGCSRDPDSDPHEDLAYVGKTVRLLAVRWAEHLKSTRMKDGVQVPNNSAIYRHRRQLTGFSADPRVYDTPDALAAAEDRAIKALWPAWNIQEQDRRNPHTRATRAYRKPDRLAPLIGVASVLWGLMWAAVTAGLLWVAWDTRAAWYWIVACPLVALYLVNGTALRHAARLARHKRRRSR